MTVTVPINLPANRWDADNKPEENDVLRRLLDLEARTYRLNQGGSSSGGTPTTTAINLTLTTAHYWVKVTAACTIALPRASSVSGREYIVTATANGVVVDGNASETISGSLTVTLNTGDTIQIKSDGANWFII